MKKKSSPESPSLMEILHSILEKAKKQKKFTLKELFQVFARRGYPIILILLSLPFCQPIQIPGFSAPFGLMIMFIGFRMAFGKHVWWPQVILKKEVSSATLQKVIKKSLWLIEKLQKILHVRWTWVFAYPFQPLLHGITIMGLGLFLALPLPIPLTNIIAAWGVLLIAIGLLEEDGVAVCLGYVAAIICLIILLAIAFSLSYLASM